MWIAGYQFAKGAAGSIGPRTKRLERLASALTGTIVSGDGQSNWFKGVQLVTVYAIIALMFYFLRS